MRKHTPIPKSNRPTGFEHLMYDELLSARDHFSQSITDGVFRSSGSKSDAKMMADLNEEIRRREERGDTAMPPRTMVLKLGGEVAEVRVQP